MEALGLSLATLLMEGAWIAGVAAVATRIYGPLTAPLLPLWAAVLTLAAGYASGAVLLRRRGPEPAPDDLARAWLTLLLGCVWSAAVVSIVRHLAPGADGAGLGWLLALPDALGRVLQRPHPDLLALAMTLFAWWRGQRAGARAPDFGAVVRAFGLGSLLYAGALLLAAPTVGTPPGAGTDALLLLGAGLPALSLARLRDVRRDAVAAGGGAPAGVERTWLQATAIPVCAVLAVALGASLLLGDDGVRRTLQEGLGLAGTLLWWLLYWPLLAVGFVAEWLLLALRRIAPRLQVRLPAEPSFRPPEDLLPQPDPTTGGLPWLDALRWVPVAIAILVAVAGFLATSRSVRRGVGLSPGTAADRESLWSWTELWRAWRRWLAHLCRRWLRRVRIGVAPAGSGRSRGNLDTRERAAGPRALYRRLLALGRERGLTRIPAQTPQEYLGAWREALPGEEEVGMLTAAYERARYGERGDGQTEGAGSRAATELRPVLDRLARRLAQLERG